MAFPQRRAPLAPATITRKPEIMGGWPCVDGTRIPAMTIVAEIRAGTPHDAFFEHYPSLSPDGIEAVRHWAEAHRISLAPDATDDPFEDDDGPLPDR